MVPGRTPTVVVHSFGARGAGGPIAVVDGICSSRLADAYRLVRMHQSSSNGSLDVPRLREWVRFLKDTNPDIVHVAGLGNEGFHAVLAARIAGCRRILVTVHGTHRDLVGARGLRHWAIVRMLEPATLAMATHINTVCEFAQARPFIRRRSRKLAPVVANGVDLEAVPSRATEAHRAAWGATLGDVVLISVGRLSEQKGHGDLAQALRLLPTDSVARLLLVVVGDGLDAEQIHTQYRDSGVRVRMLGTRSDVPELLASADVFVFPSWHENLSVALLEAMGAGLPVVATSVGGNTEVVSRGGGLLVEPHEAGALADAIDKLASDAGLRTQLGTEARRIVTSTYSTESMINALDAVYTAVLRGRS